MFPAEERRYTLSGPDAVERRIACDQERVTAEIDRHVAAGNLAGLVLAGGYGRGEGGYRFDRGAVVPYNDYDYFVVVQSVAPRALARLRREVHGLAESLGREFGLEVDFAVLERERLAKLPDCLMYSELKAGHRVLSGDPRVLDALRVSQPAKLPLAEFSRMMLNRGALLLMNAQALGSGVRVRTDGSERFLRYFSKGVLAAADARLAAAGRYDPSVAERGRRIREIPWPVGDRERFLELHERATRIKLGGDDTRSLQAGEPQRLQRLAVHEWLEAYRVLETARLGAVPDTWQAYASPSVGKGQGTARWWSPLLHVALALRASSGRTASFSLDRLVRHPRERLMAALPLLLEPGAQGQSALAAEALGAPQREGWDGLAEFFLADWRRYC